jgi:hypothetical protein
VISLSAARAVVDARREKQRRLEAKLKRFGMTSRRILKARKDRAEDARAAHVRAACVLRDGHCRLSKDNPVHVCQGFSEWCHTHAKRRSKTRKMAPEIRHTTADSFMACTSAHDRYDNRKRPKLGFTALTDRGCDGPIAWQGE